MTGRASAGGQFRCQNKKRTGQGRHFVGPALSFMVVTAPVPRRCPHRRCRCGMGHRRRRRCRGSLRCGGLSPGGFRSAGRWHRRHRYRIADRPPAAGGCSGGTGHGRPGQFCGAVVDIDIRQAGFLTSVIRGCHEDIRSQPAGGEHEGGILCYAAGGGQIHHLLSVAVESALTIRLPGQEDGLLQIRGDLQLPDAVGGQQVGQQPRQLAALQPRQSVPA